MENNIFDKISKMFRYLEHNYKFKTKIGYDGSISDLIKEYPDTSRFCYISYLEVSNFDQNNCLIVEYYFGQIVKEIILKTLKEHKITYIILPNNKITLF